MSSYGTHKRPPQTWGMSVGSHSMSQPVASRDQKPMPTENVPDAQIEMRSINKDVSTTWFASGYDPRASRSRS